MTITASAAGVRAAVTRQCSLSTAMELITALSSVNNASRYSDQTLSGAAKMGRKNFHTVVLEEHIATPLERCITKNCLNSVAFQRMTSLNEHGLRANSQGMYEERLN